MRSLKKKKVSRFMQSVFHCLVVEKQGESLGFNSFFFLFFFFNFGFCIEFLIELLKKIEALLFFEIELVCGIRLYF